jgi:transcriptional regulator NrdR family protein
LLSALRRVEVACRRLPPDHEGLQFLRWRICRRCHQLFETAERVTGKTMALPALRVDGGDQSPPT